VEPINAIAKVLSWGSANRDRIGKLDALHIVKEKKGWGFEGVDETLKKELISCEGLAHGMVLTGELPVYEKALVKDVISRLVPYGEKRDIRSALTAFGTKELPGSPYILVEEEPHAGDDGEGGTAPAEDLIGSLIELGLEDFREIEGLVSDDWVLLRGISHPVHLAEAFRAGAAIMRESRMDNLIGLSPFEYSPVPEAMLLFLRHYHPGRDLFIFPPGSGGKAGPRRLLACDSSHFSLRVFDFRMADAPRVEHRICSPKSDAALKVPVSLKRVRAAQRSVGGYSGVLLELDLPGFLETAASIESELSALHSASGEPEADVEQAAGLREKISHAYVDDEWTGDSCTHDAQGSMLLKIDGMPAKELLRSISLRLGGVMVDIEKAQKLIVGRANNRVLGEGHSRVEAFRNEIGAMLNGLVSQKVGEYAYPILERLNMELGASSACRGRYYRVTHAQDEARFELYVDCNFDLVPRFPLEDARVRTLVEELLSSSLGGEAPSNGGLVVLLSRDNDGVTLRCVGRDAFRPFGSIEGKLETARVLNTTPEKIEDFKEFIGAAYRKTFETELDESVSGFASKWFAGARRVLESVQWMSMAADLEDLEKKKIERLEQLGRIGVKSREIDDSIRRFESGSGATETSAQEFLEALHRINSLSAAGANARITPEQLAAIREIPKRIHRLLASDLKSYSLARIKTLLKELAASLERLRKTLDTIAFSDKNERDLYSALAESVGALQASAGTTSRRFAARLKTALPRIENILTKIQEKL